MGNCSSCLGGNRSRDDYDVDDESRLLFDDPNGLHYGSIGEQQMTGHEDPQEVQREIEALQRVVARTSDNMVDIYEIVPNDKIMQAAPAYAGQEARMMRYQNLLSKLASQNELAAVAKIDWEGPDDLDGLEMQKAEGPQFQVKADAAGPLVGGFTDAAEAMR